jgi:dolichyl-phosphate beta-glucosyltransferase
MTGTVRLETDFYTMVVPCYNEEQRLPVAAFTSFLLSPPAGLRFLFVNDGSTDNTLVVLQHLKADCPGLVDVLDQTRNGGKAEAVRCGMLHAIAAGASITGFWDADLATPLSELPRLLNLLLTQPSVEIVLGSRVRLLGRSILRKPVRHYSGRIFATIASLTLNLPVYDTQCGSKLFRVTQELHEALAAPFGSRWIFDVELLARFLVLRQKQYPELGDPSLAVYEEPLRHWTDVDGSKLKTSDAIKAFGEIWKIRRTYFGRR